MNFSYDAVKHMISEIGLSFGYIGWKIVLALLFGYIVGVVNLGAILPGLISALKKRNNPKINKYIPSRRRDIFIASVLIDMIKSYAAMKILMNLVDTEIIIIFVALGIFIGHIFPVYYGFRGGRGVTVGFAVVLAIDRKVAIIALCVFLIMIILIRYLSCASVLSAFAAIVASFVFYGSCNLSFFLLVIGAIMVFMYGESLLAEFLGYKGPLW